jgi:hypothetical protein
MSSRAVRNARRLPVDIIARIRFRTTKEGGRGTPTLYQWYGCLFEYGGEHFDCVLNLEKVGPVKLGDEITVSVGFLCPGLIKSRLSKGDTFTLWEGKTIADGEVIEIGEQTFDSVDDSPFDINQPYR